MHLVCQVSAPIVANIATFELPGRLSYFYLASLLDSLLLNLTAWNSSQKKKNGMLPSVLCWQQCSSPASSWLWVC
jgi:hypothetical protein